MDLQITDKNIYLIGMMGSWKTTIGRLVADHLALPFLDTDAELEREMKMNIPQIFKHLGEVRFRTEESQLLQRLAITTDQVISTGGGIILRNENRRLLQSSGIVIFLKAQPATLAKRIQNVAHRPILHHSDDTAARLKELWEERKEFYESTAHLSFDTDHSSPDKLARQIWSQLRKPDDHS